MAMSLALLHTSARISWTEFSVHPSTVIGIIGLAGLYEYRRWALGDGRGADQQGDSNARRQRPGAHRRFWFHGALLVLFFSLNGPLHDLSDSYLFSAHMVQHLLLAFVVAPMLLMGVTGDMLRPLISKPPVRRLAEWALSPVPCFAIFNVVIAGWHLPPLYNYALAHHPVHIVEHLLMLAAAVVMWWPILSPLPELPRLSYPGQMLYLFLMSIPMAIVAVYIAYSDGILYPMYASAPRVWGISPMNDQMIGGLIMWIPGGLFFYTVISVVFFRWNQRGAEDSQASAQVDWRTV
jgi:putative membrane protein